MRWVFLGCAVCGFAGLWGMGANFVLLAAFIVMFANFASFCLLYERPMDRARLRVAQRLRLLHPNTDEAQRLSTATITASVADHHLGLGPMTLLNAATGIAGLCLLIWGIVLRIL